MRAEFGFTWFYLVLPARIPGFPLPFQSAVPVAGRKHLKFSPSPSWRKHRLSPMRCLLNGNDFLLRSQRRGNRSSQFFVDLFKIRFQISAFQHFSISEKGFPSITAPCFRLANKTWMPAGAVLHCRLEVSVPGQSAPVRLCTFWGIEVQGQRLEEILPIHIIQKNILPPVPPAHDMIHRPGILDT